jgi:hypothetical protein
VPNYGVDGIYVVIVRGAVAETLDFIGTGGALDKLQAASHKPQATNPPSPSPSPFKGEGIERRGCLPSGTRPLDHLTTRPLSGADGIVSDWFQEQYDLSFLAVGETVQVKLGFKSDADADVGEGFYIDDVVVTGGNPPPTFIAEENGEWRMVNGEGAVLTAWPNPFGTATTIRLSLTPDPWSPTPLLRIYDATGRCVRTLPLSSFLSPLSSLSWDGLDDSGRRVPAGPYFIEARSGSEVQLTRVVLVR